MRYPNASTSNSVTISIFMEKKNLHSPWSLSLHKKNNSPLLLLTNKCKLSYFIRYRCLNLNSTFLMDEFT